MQFIIGFIGMVGSVFRWFSNRAERQAGQAEQKEEDQHKTIEQLQAELNAAANRTDASQRLRDGNF